MTLPVTYGEADAAVKAVASFEDLLDGQDPASVHKAYAKILHPDAQKTDGGRRRATKAFAKLSLLWDEHNGKNVGRQGRCQGHRHERFGSLCPRWGRRRHRHVQLAKGSHRHRSRAALMNRHGYQDNYGHNHHREVCQHGFLVAQCRCPGPKVGRLVACPDSPWHVQRLAEQIAEDEGSDMRDAVL